MIASQNKQNECNQYQPFNAGNRQVCFVTNSIVWTKFLESVLRQYQAVQQKVENNNLYFVLSKIRKYMNWQTVLLIYKQGILSDFDNADFILISCSLEKKLDLQVLQHDGLRLCKLW